MKKLVEIAGWVGVLFILGAFAANVFEIWSNKDLLYLIANAVGAALVAWSVFVKKAWPALALETVWCAVALFGIFKFFV